MAKKEKKLEETEEQVTAETAEQTEAEPQEPASDTEEEKLRKQLAEEHDSYLRLAAEYDNFRKRSAKEKEAIFTDVKVQTVAKLLPVYDNLERALAAETTDDAFKKGVEMTMSELRKIFESLGAVPFGVLGDEFDPNMHNAVMHIEDETLGKNVISQVFQCGFKLGDKIVRFAMVCVAN